MLELADVCACKRCWVCKHPVSHQAAQCLTNALAASIVTQASTGRDKHGVACTHYEPPSTASQGTRLSTSMPVPCCPPVMLYPWDLHTPDTTCTRRVTCASLHVYCTLPALVQVVGGQQAAPCDTYCWCLTCNQQGASCCCDTSKSGR